MSLKISSLIAAEAELKEQIESLKATLEQSNSRVADQTLEGQKQKERIHELEQKLANQTR